MLILSPRAIQRLETFVPDRPLPKIFRLTKGGELISGVFKGETINTPSMYVSRTTKDALDWAESEGGLRGLQSRASANFEASTVLGRSDALDRKSGSATEVRSNTSVCLKIVDPAVSGLDAAGQRAFTKKLVGLLEAEDVATTSTATAMRLLVCGSGAVRRSMPQMWRPLARGWIGRSALACRKWKLPEQPLPYPPPQRGELRRAWTQAASIKET